MRLRPADLTTTYLRSKVKTTDDEGNIIIGSWSEPILLKMNVQSASGTVNAQIWGKQLKYVKSCKYQGDLLQEGRDENKGICLYVGKDSNPDYLIYSIQTFSTHKNIVLEKIVKGDGSTG